MQNKKNILFVDDEAQILRGIRRMLSCTDNPWEMTFANGGAEALEVLEAQPIDVIVSDIRMPKMNGAELLNLVKEIYPHVIRVALSGQTSRDEVLKTVGPVHQYLTKPCSEEMLTDTINRVCSLQGFLANTKLQMLISQLESLPFLPNVYADLMTALQSENVMIEEVGEIISRDVGMSAKILQLVNSAFFGITQPISDITRAVILLGLNTTKALVLSAKIFSQFDKIEVDDFSLNRLWTHSLTVGEWAKLIAVEENADQNIIEYAMMTGMLHDVGKLVLVSTMPKEYQEVLRLADVEHIPVCQAEKQVINATHAEVGAYLLGLWGFSPHVTDAVLYHHCPKEAKNMEFSTLTAVYIANQLAGKDCPAELISKKEISFDTEYLNQLGLTEHIPQWQELCTMKANVTN